MMYHGDNCSLSSPLVTFGYSLLLLVHFIGFTFSVRCFLWKLQAYISRRNNHFTSLATILFALLGDMSGVVICTCGALRSLFVGDQNLESTLLGISAIVLGVVDFFCCLNVCLVWITLAVVGASFGKRGRNLLLGLCISYVLLFVLTLLVTAHSLVGVFIGLGSLYDIVFALVFVKASQLLSAKLTQVAASIPQQILTPQKNDYAKINAEIKNQAKGFFHLQSKTSSVLQVQPKGVSLRVVGAKKKYLPSFVSASLASWSMAVHQSSSTTVKQEETEEKKTDNESLCHMLFSRLIQIANSIIQKPSKPNLNIGPASFLERNYQLIQRVKKCSKWLSRFSFVCSIASAILAPVCTSPNVGALPCICLFVSLFANLLARATIVEYMWGSHRSATGFLSTS